MAHWSGVIWCVAHRTAATRWRPLCVLKTHFPFFSPLELLVGLHWTSLLLQVTSTHMIPYYHFTFSSCVVNSSKFTTRQVLSSCFIMSSKRRSPTSLSYLSSGSIAFSRRSLITICPGKLETRETWKKKSQTWRSFGKTSQDILENELNVYSR